MTIEHLRTQRRDEILRLAASRGARNVRVFGSVARRSLLDLGCLNLDLERLLGSRVDVVSSRGLRNRVRERVLREAVAL